MNVSAWELIRAVRGPILLTTFGTLMALNHTDRFDFERSWPVLVIVYGLFKLLERMVVKPVPPNLPPHAIPSWNQPAGFAAPQYQPVQQYPTSQYPAPTPPAPQYPPVYPPPSAPEGGAQ